MSQESQWSGQELVKRLRERAETIYDAPVGKTSYQLYAEQAVDFNAAADRLEALLAERERWIGAVEADELSAAIIHARRETKTALHVDQTDWEDYDRRFAIMVIQRLHENRGTQVSRLSKPSSAANLSTPQPPPVHNDNPSCHDLVIADMQDRRAFGLQKYGTILQPGNGRDFLTDAYQEVLDLAVYMRGAIYEKAAQASSAVTEEELARVIQQAMMGDCESGYIARAVLSHLNADVTARNTVASPISQEGSIAPAALSEGER